MFVNEVNIIDICSKLDWLVFFFSIFITLLSIWYGNKIKSKKLKCINDVGNINNKHNQININVQNDINSQESNGNTKLKFIEHLLMGRRLTLPLFIATLTSSWYGGIFGVTQIAFEHGIYNFVTQGLFWYIAYFLFAIFLAKKINASKALTMPNLITKLYGSKSAKLGAVIILTKTLPISYAISIGLFLQLMFPINLTLAITIGVLLVGTYCYFGGLRAIVFSDVVQFFIMCLGVFSVLLFSLIKFGGLPYLKANLPASYFTIKGDYSFSYTISWLFIAFSSTFVDPTFYQRCLAAKNPKVASNGILISIFIWFLFDICTTFGAMYAKAAIPDANALNGYLTYALQVLPVGFKGLLLASILATVLSTLDAQLFLASNVLFFDLKILKVKNIQLKSLLAIGIIAIGTIIFSTFFDGKIEASWRIFNSYFSACFLIPFLWGYIFPKYRKDSYFFFTSSLCIVIVFVWDIFNLQNYFAGIDSFYIGNLVAILTLFYLNIAKVSFQKPSFFKTTS